MGWVFSVGGGPRAYYDRFRRTEIAMVMVLVLLVVVRCPMVGEDDERQYVAFSFLPFSNLNDDTIPTCVSTYGASHMGIAGKLGFSRICSIRAKCATRSYVRKSVHDDVLRQSLLSESTWESVHFSHIELNFEYSKYI